MAGRTLEFLFADALRIKRADPPVERLPAIDDNGFLGINGSSAPLAETGHAAHYLVILPPRAAMLALEYRGLIDRPLIAPSSAPAGALVIGRWERLAGSSAGLAPWYPSLGIYQENRSGA